MGGDCGLFARCHSIVYRHTLVYSRSTSLRCFSSALLRHTSSLLSFVFLTISISYCETRVLFSELFNLKMQMKYNDCWDEEKRDQILSNDEHASHCPSSHSTLAQKRKNVLQNSIQYYNSFLVKEVYYTVACISLPPPYTPIKIFQIDLKHCVILT